MSLSSLSKELRIATISHINLPQALVNLPRTCKILSVLVEPFLYSTFNQNYSRTAGCFLRTIYHKPYLALHVKHIDLRGPDQHQYDPLDKIYSQQLELDMIEHDKLICGWIRDQLSDTLYGSEFRDMWFQTIFCNENWDATIALLVVILSESLKSITLHHYPSGRSFPAINEVLEIITVGKITSQSAKTLSRLRRVKINFGGKKLEDSMAPTVPWLQLPSVKALEVVEASMGIETDLIHMPQSFYTEMLFLSCNNVSRPSFLKDFLSNFHSLKLFEYHHAVQLGARIRGPISEGLVQGLHVSAKCLELRDIA